MRIYKYILKINSVGICEIPLPKNYKLLKIANQAESITLWAEVDSSAPLLTETFAIMPTGVEAPADEQWDYIDTVLLSGGALVFHVYRRIA